MSRAVSRIITAQRQTEGAGFVVRRPFPGAAIDMVDPFLLFDHLGPVDYAPGQALGTPDHPHRGIEIVSYVIEGELEHLDSEGHQGSLGAGDVQWMTAGAGIVHSEQPSRRLLAKGGRSHGFQIWVNLPARDKMIKPRYQEIPAANIPQAKSADGKLHVRVIAGEALGARAVIETRTPIFHQHWTLQPGATVDQPVPTNYNVLAYVFMGEGLIGADARAMKESQLAILGPGDTVRLACAPTAQEPLQVLLLGGVPLNEPVARSGPFVMNTKQEIMQAIQDYQSGRMGRIRR